MTNAEIQVGEYVRTKKHGIFKVVEIHKTEYGYYVLSTDTFEVFTIGKGFSHEIKNDIVKHSFNLIDIIKVGDYVNGHQVFGFCKVGDTRCYLHVNDYECSGLGHSIYPEDIQTIVTKEAFSAMEYKIGGENE